jgi:hypothetical protein
LAKVDPANREVALSLGAFLENLIVAAPAYAYLAESDGIGPSSARGPIHVRLTQSAQGNARLEQTTGAIVGRPQTVVSIHAIATGMTTRSATNARRDGLIQTRKRRSAG